MKEGKIKKIDWKKEVEKAREEVEELEKGIKESKEKEKIEELERLADVYRKIPDQMSDSTFFLFILTLGVLWYLGWYLPFWIIMVILVIAFFSPTDNYKIKRKIEKEMLEILEGE
jgi:hypothetical protein